jgi:GDP-L-fucose synthase
MSVNVGAGTDIPIADLAQLIAQVVGYDGGIQWDASKPDGTPRKLLDCSRLAALGWKSRIELTQGLTETYAWYQGQATVPKTVS